MYLTEFVPGERLVIEESKEESLAAQIGSACVMLIFALPVLLLGAYCFLAQQPIPPTIGRAVVGFQMLFAVILYIIPSGARRITFTPGASGQGKAAIAGVNIVGLSRPVTQEGPSLFLRIDKGPLGGSAFGASTGMEPEKFVMVEVKFVHSKEDFAHLVFCVANATGLRHCCEVGKANKQMYQLSADPGPGTHPIPDVECNFPRHLKDIESQFANRFEPFDPRRVSSVAKIQEWQSGRLLSMKPNELRERLALAAGAALAVTLAFFWISSVWTNWPEASLVDRALWITSVALIGVSAAYLRAFDLLITGGTRFKVDNDGFHSRMGLWSGTTSREEISSVGVVYLRDDAYGRKVEQVVVYLFANLKSDLVVKARCSDVCQDAAAAITLALEIGRILKRPVRISDELVAKFQSSPYCTADTREVE